jgi:hypothetical protein
MSDKDTIIRDGYSQGLPLELISQQAGLHRSNVIQRAKKMGLTHPNSGGKNYNRIQQTITDLGIDPKAVDHGWIKTEEASIHFRNDLPTRTIDDLLSDTISILKKHSPKYQPIKRIKIREPHLLVVDIADLHIGKLALAVETGEDYNIEIAKQRAIEGVEGLIQRAQGFPIDKILFVIGNDILHFDNNKRTTTGGTPQDTDGQLHQIFNEGVKLYVDIIERLVTIADVDVVYNPSNHDYASGYMLAQTVAAWFRLAKNVTFDVSIRHRKHYTYGNNLITTSHGDGAKHNDMPFLMAHEHPDWSNKTPQKRYVYLHHLHHKKVTKWNSSHDTDGIHLQILRSPSAPDSYHDKNGYVAAPRAVEGFIHHKEHGQIAQLTHYFS